MNSTLLHSHQFIDVFASTGYDQLRAVFDEYDKLTKFLSIDDFLAKELRFLNRKNRVVFFVKKSCKNTLR